MISFGEIYNSLKADFTPQKRNLEEIGIILSTAYSVLRNPKFVNFSPFVPGNEDLGIDRTTVERLIEEIKQVRVHEKGTGESYVIASEGIEKAIANIQTLNIYAKNPEIDYHEVNVICSGVMDASLKYIVHISRIGLLKTKQHNIQDHLASLKSRDEKLNYLHDFIYSLKQNKKRWDNYIYENMLSFLDLEIRKWLNFVENKSFVKTIETAQQLHDFIIRLLHDELKHNIEYLDGYKVFWRDELCISDPKKENEIHHFIKSILKPYCDEYGIKIMRENSVANGKIDMTFVYLNHSVCLEVKKANHQDILTAINTQLTEYMIGEKTQYGVYLILWYKSENGFKYPANYINYDELIRDIEIQRDDYQYHILGINCSKPISPSEKK